jgi:hypothetical protein
MPVNSAISRLVLPAESISATIVARLSTSMRETRLPPGGFDGAATCSIAVIRSQDSIL